MPAFAQIVLIGHLGRDPELTYLPSGTPTMKFSLCVNTGFGEKKIASWYSCAMFGKQAEALQKHLAKGKAVLVSGEPSIRNWVSKEGKSGTSAEVRVNELKFVGGREDKQESHEPKEEPSGPVEEQKDFGDVPF